MQALDKRSHRERQRGSERGSSPPGSRAAVPPEAGGEGEDADSGGEELGTGRRVDVAAAKGTSKRTHSIKRTDSMAAAANIEWPREEVCVREHTRFVCVCVCVCVCTHTHTHTHTGSAGCTG
jgi:hypothetical protein